MKLLASLLQRVNTRYLYTALVLLLLSGFYTFKLGTLPDGLSATEKFSGSDPVGWRGIYDDPFYLPLTILRSVVFFLQPDHGIFLTRISNVPFGIVSIVAFFIVIKWWYGNRVAAYSTVLFATSAWSLHVSRFAGYEALYFMAFPVLLACHVALQRFRGNKRVFMLSLFIWLLLLYVPGLVWLILLSVYMQKRFIAEAINKLSIKQRLITIFGCILLTLLLLRHFLRPGAFLTWLGLPSEWGTPLHIVKEIVAVPVHLFIRGPQYPELWLGKAPILDIFCLTLAIIGFYFYATRLSAIRSKLLIGALIVGALFVALQGPVTISLLVPLLFVFVATGLAYLLKEWLQVFPNNPIARGLGLGLVMIAIATSAVYNTRAYFVAWPHATETKSTFRYHR